MPKNETKPCKPCRGTGRTYSQSPFMGGWECTSCNGTGIHGEPWKGLAIAITVTLIVVWIVYRIAIAHFD